MSIFNPPSTDIMQQGIQAGQQIAGQQQGYNTQAGIQSQAGSMVNQNNPYGSLTYGQVGTGPNGVPIYGSNVNFSPGQQQLYNQLLGTQQSGGNQAFNLMTGAGYGNQSPATAIGGLQSGFTGQMMNQETNYLNPFFQTSRSQLDTQLRNQGLQPGEPGYDNAMRGLDTSQGLTVSNFEANALPQTYNMATQSYLMPAELGTKLAQFGAPTSPNSGLVNTPQLNIQPANLEGAVSTQEQAAQSQYNAQQQQYQNMMSGLFGIGTSVLGGIASGGLTLPTMLSMNDPMFGAGV